MQLMRSVHTVVAVAATGHDTSTIVMKCSAV